MYFFWHEPNTLSPVPVSLKAWHLERQFFLASCCTSYETQSVSIVKTDHMYVFRSLCTASFLSNCNQNQCVSTKLVKIPNMICLEYLSRSSTVPCGKIDQWTDMAGLFTICFTDAPKMCHSGGHVADVRRQGICHYHMCKVKIPSSKSVAAYADFSDTASD